MMKKFVILALVASSLLSACGQKGPLYIDGNPERTAKEKLDEYYKRY